MNILLVSNTPWNDSNSFGNSFSNIFDGIDDLRFANIYCRPGEMKNQFDMVGYQVTESLLIKNLMNESIPSGKIVYNQKSDAVERSELEQKTFDKARTLRWQVLFWGRDLVWKIGRWKSQALIDFIDDFKPDIIFQPVYFSSYLNDIVSFIKEHTNAPMVGYISDDNYTLKQFSLSPLYWIDRIIKRRKVKKTIEQCELLYVISDVQKKEYEKIFTPPCKILTKCADFSDDKKPDFKEPGKILKMVYAGNVSKGRYEILAELAKVTEKLNRAGKKFELDIYTLSPLTEKQKNILSTDSVRLHPPVSYTKIREIQKNSDILIHVEGFSLRERLAVHQSFSTKIVDYLETNRCIFAIGDGYCSSIQYFINNKCGLVATTKEDIKKELLRLHKNRDLLKTYAQKGWESGKKYHHKQKMQNMVKSDLNNIVCK